MDVIVPCAGLSTRYPGTLPKFVLSCHDGRMMLENVLEQYINKFNIYVTILKEHDVQFNIVKRLRYIFNDRINITVLDNRTNGSADTVYQTIKHNKLNGTILVRDCDSFFNHEIEENGNRIYCNHIDGHLKLTQKSYVEFNEHNIVSNIVEKKIIGEYFCVGGYQFDSALEYCKVFETLNNTSKEIYISTIIGCMIGKNSIFLRREVNNYVDLNDLEQFDKYNDKPTYFCDIDGVICKVQSRYDDNPFVDYEPIEDNVNTLLSEQARGCKIVFTTARDGNFYDETYTMLTELGFKDFRLLMDITRSRRVVINDYDRIYPTCSAICIKSEVPELKKFIK